jgi:hypothetical protein
MEQSSHNENKISNAKGCEIIMDVVMQEEKTANPSKNHDNLQIEASINSKRKKLNNERKFQKIVSSKK